MKRSRSIQFRLTVWYGLVLAGALALFGGMIWLSLRQRLFDETDSELKDSASRVESYFRKESAQESGDHLKQELDEFCQALPASSYLYLHGSSGFQFTHADRGRQSHLRISRTSFTVGNEAFTLDVGTSIRSVHHTLEQLRFLLLSLIPVVIFIACLAGAWISRRALRPVDRITAAARLIGIENLARRLPVPPTGDELERLTEVWNTMLARLDSAVTTLSQFAADASHELRTPLAVIRTSAEVALRRARSPESYRESLTEIVMESERMTQLVEDLLFLARSGSGAGVMTMSPLRLADVLTAIIDEMRDVAASRNVGVRLIAPGEARLVSGSPTSLRRLFLVLLDNAIKYSHPGGEVEVRISTNVNPDGVVVTVRDCGIGIPPTDLPHIFQRFYRADKARGSSGHGLGLSLAETIAQAHGAGIEVASTEAAGSTFTVTFPLRSRAVDAGSIMIAAISGQACP